MVTSSAAEDGSFSLNTLNDSVVLTAEQVVDLGPVQTIALLEPGETLDAASAPANTMAIAMADLGRLREVAAKGPTVLTCRHGLRSVALARLLRAEGRPNIHALAGALSAIRPGR